MKNQSINIAFKTLSIINKDRKLGNIQFSTKQKSNTKQKSIPLISKLLRRKA